MSRNNVIVSLVFVGLSGLVQSAFSQDNFDATLTRAQALYYEARFKDSVDLLLPVDLTLRERPDRIKQSISVKLQLALGYIGQNQIAEAKSVFQEVCMLDSNYALDSTQFAPKVLALFDDARADQKKAKCDAFCAQLQDLAQKADTLALIRLSKLMGDGCFCGAAVGAAEVLFKQGVDAYKQEDFGQALEKLRAALRFHPAHDMTLQYVELAEGKVKLAVDRLAFDWRKQFEAQEFPKATATYRQLQSLNIEGKADAPLEQMRGEYRTAVRVKAEAWTQSCSSDAPLSLEAFRQQTRDFLPSEAIAVDMLSKLAPCAPKVIPKLPAPPKVAVARGCLTMPSQVAMARIKTRVNPEIPPQRMPTTPVSLTVKVRIDESGNVEVKDIAGGSLYLNEAMKIAIEKWKFIPARTEEDGSRCVEAELPVVLSRS
jgi:hypothetical protein